MDSVIEYLNLNQGAVMAALTLVYVIATIVIVYFNKMSIDEMRISRKEETRPYVFAYFAFIPRETKRCTLVVRNNGKSGAKIEQFSITPKVTLIKGASDCSFFENTIIAPGQSIRLMVLDLDSTMADAKYGVSISYTRVSGKESYEDNYSMLHQYFGESGYTDTSRSDASKAENALMDISRSLDTIKTNLL